MATKTTKSPSKKATTKKKGILSKINFSSRKTQFLATILVIAVAGAGYFTYQSFAGVTAEYVYNAGNSYLMTGTGSSYYTETAKNNMKVIKMPPGARATVSSARVGEIYVPASQYHRLCLTEKGITQTTGSQPMVEVSYITANAGGQRRSRNLVVPGTNNKGYNSYAKDVGNGYYEVCSDLIDRSQLSGPIILTNISNKTLYTSNFKIIFEASSDTPAPAPAPAK